MNDALITLARLKGYNLPLLGNNELDMCVMHQWLRLKKGKNIGIFPEYYADGINWQMQVTWFLPEQEWLFENGERVDNIYTGTGLYGDNNEYPTYEKALEAGLIMAFTSI